MKMAWILLSTCALTACVDLSAVRDYANNSNNAMTASEAIFAGSSDSYDHAHQVALSPNMPAYDKDFIAQLNADAAKSKTFGPLNTLAAQTLHHYFATLTAGADAGLVDFSAQATSIGDSLAKLNVQSPAKDSAVAIIKFLQVPLDFARQETLRDLILNSNKDVQVLTRYLAESAAFVGNRRLEVGGVLETYYRVSYVDSRDPAAQAMVRGLYWGEQSATATDEAKAKAATTALLTIGKDHKILFDNAQHLSSAALKSTLTGDAPLIEGVVKLFLPK